MKQLPAAENERSVEQLPPDSAAFNPLDALRILRSAGNALFAQAALHGKLARVEWTQEKKRLLTMVATVLLGFACLLCVLMFSGALVLAFTWDSVYRVPAALILLAMYSLGILIAWHRLRSLAARGDQAFSALREELAADMALIKSKL